MAHANHPSPPLGRRERTLRLATIALLSTLGLATLALLSSQSDDAAAAPDRLSTGTRVDQAHPVSRPSSPHPSSALDRSPAARANEETGAALAFVAQKQHESQRERDAFAADGWTFVTTNAPDTQLVDLDPRRLSQDERALRTQLESTSLGDAQVANARTLALTASSRRTRTAALAALGRADSDAARAALRECFDGLSADDGARAFTVAQLRPGRFGDDTTRWLATRLTDDALSPALREPMALSLVFAALAASERDGQPARERLLRALPEAAHPLALTFFTRVTQATALRTHHHAH